MQKRDEKIDLNVLQSFKKNGDANVRHFDQVSADKGKCFPTEKVRVSVKAVANLIFPDHIY